MADSFSTRLARAVADPWVLLVSALGGGMGWAVSGGDFNVGGAIGFGMLGVAGVTGALLKGGGEPEPDDGLPELRKGTQQARLTEALEGYLSDLRQLRGTKLPDSVTDSAIEALVATDGAHAAAMRVAVAADKLDEAIARSQRIAGSGGVAVPSGVRDSLQRMGERRAGLLAKLDKAVSEVAEVYTKLLELTATVDTLDVGGPQLGDVETVNNSLDSLRSAFAELERDAERPTA
jgi:hypothetical protein